MNLLETLINNGQTFSVTHNKNNVDMSTKLISLTLKKEDVVDINYDLKLNVKTGTSKFEISESFFNSIPKLKLAGTGIREILHGNKLYVLVCDKDGSNPFKLTPVSLASMKGAEKSLSFKNDAILAGLSIANIQDTTQDGIYYFSLNATEVENLYIVEKVENNLKVSVPVEQVLNSQVIDETPTVNSIPEIEYTTETPKTLHKNNIFEAPEDEEVDEEINEEEDIFNI